MNFQLKNFQYVKKPFGKFMQEVCDGSPQYLRSLNAEKAADEPARFADDFPGLSDQFHLPPQLATVARNQHSSPLRISGPVNMWLHYDVRCIGPHLEKPMLMVLTGHGQRALYHTRRKSVSFVPAARCGPFQDTTRLVFIANGGIPSRATWLCRVSSASYQSGSQRGRHPLHPSFVVAQCVTTGQPECLNQRVFPQPHQWLCRR